MLLLCIYKTKVNRTFSCSEASNESMSYSDRSEGTETVATGVGTAFFSDSRSPVL